MEQVTRVEFDGLQRMVQKLADKLKELQAGGSPAFATQKCGCAADDARAAAESRNGELSAAERSEQKPSAAPQYTQLTDRQSKPFWPQSLWEAWGIEALWHPERRQWVWPSELRKDGYGVAANGSASKASTVETAALSLAKEIERETEHLHKLSEAKGCPTGKGTSSASKAGVICTSVQEKDLAERERAAYLRGFQDAKKLLANVVPDGYVMVKQHDNFLWVNVYKHPVDGSYETSTGYPTEDAATAHAVSNRVACVRVWFSEGWPDE